ncbi:hypothetical protein JZ785_04660 [Alicyclobacillus curvatus]|nr:hypothetical protein JZ785_04660 [Alicyclobacillus curvatus]
MCELARKLLVEKLVDDFYENDRETADKEQKYHVELAEQLKAFVPVEQHGLLYRWEAECAETCGQELRRFGDFVASFLVACDFNHEDADERMSSPAIQD